MTSTRIKNQARAIQRANPGMKYTEALRLAERKPLNIDPISDPTSITKALDAVGIEHTLIQLPAGEPGMLDPFALAEQHETTGPRPLERSTPPDVVHLEPTSVESATREAMRTKAERMTASAGGVDALDSSKLIEVDEWHSMAPSAEAEALIRELIRMGRTSKRGFSPDCLADLTLGFCVELDSPSRTYQVPMNLLGDGGNLVVCGVAMAGHTEALRALAYDAVRGGWGVSIADLKGEYGDVPGAMLSPGSEAGIKGFIESLVPGSEDVPHLVVVDYGAYLLGSEDGGVGWVQALEALMLDPYTAVAIHFSSPSAIPTRLARHLGNRLLLGKTSRMARVRMFQGIAPEDAVKAFDFDFPEWTGTRAQDTGRGVLWDDGGRLRHVRTRLV